jgi:hypothetical protein
MKFLPLFYILLIAFLIYPVEHHNSRMSLFIQAFAQEDHKTAKPNQTAIGKIEKTGDGKVRVDRNPCGDSSKIIIFSGNFRIKELGQRQCNNGKTYKAVKATQF